MEEQKNIVGSSVEQEAEKFAPILKDFMQSYAD